MSLQKLEAAGEQRVEGGGACTCLPASELIRANEAGLADRTCGLLQGGCTQCATHPHADTYSAVALIICGALVRSFHFTFTCWWTEKEREGDEEAVRMLFGFRCINI